MQNFMKCDFICVNESFQLPEWIFMIINKYLKRINILIKKVHNYSMSASGSIPGGVVNFNLKIFNLGARRGGDVRFLIARLYITSLD